MTDIVASCETGNHDRLLRHLKPIDRTRCAMMTYTSNHNIRKRAWSTSMPNGEPTPPLTTTAKEQKLESGIGSFVLRYTAPAQTALSLGLETIYAGKQLLESATNRVADVLLQTSASSSSTAAADAIQNNILSWDKLTLWTRAHLSHLLLRLVHQFAGTICACCSLFPWSSASSSSSSLQSLTSIQLWRRNNDSVEKSHAIAESVWFSFVPSFSEYVAAVRYMTVALCPKSHCPCASAWLLRKITTWGLVSMSSCSAVTNEIKFRQTSSTPLDHQSRWPVY